DRECDLGRRRNPSAPDPVLAGARARGARSEAPGSGGSEVMLRMDGFEVHTARTPEEAVSLFGSLEGVHYVAGGTDLVPNLTHRIASEHHLAPPSTAPPRRPLSADS